LDLGLGMFAYLAPCMVSVASIPRFDTKPMGWGSIDLIQQISAFSNHWRTECITTVIVISLRDRARCNKKKKKERSDGTSVAPKRFE
jgi:hypothetical protein